MTIEVFQFQTPAFVFNAGAIVSTVNVAFLTKEAGKTGNNGCITVLMIYQRSTGPAYHWQNVSTTKPKTKKV